MRRSGSLRSRFKNTQSPLTLLPFLPVYALVPRPVGRTYIVYAPLFLSPHTTFYYKPTILGNPVFFHFFIPARRKKLFMFWEASVSKPSFAFVLLAFLAFSSPSLGHEVFPSLYTSISLPLSLCSKLSGQFRHKCDGTRSRLP
jgi:hypothetical protein